MSGDYMLICFDCRVYLHFGKLYWWDGLENPLESCTFQGLYEDEKRCWHKRDEFFGIVMERFLIAHRNHELRFVPEGVDEFLELGIDATEVRALDADDVVKLVTKEVDWDLERKTWQRKLQVE